MKGNKNVLSNRISRTELKVDTFEVVVVIEDKVADINVISDISPDCDLHDR